MNMTESFVSTQSASRLRAAGADWIEGCWIPGNCGNIRKEINICPFRILNIVFLILSLWRSHYIRFVLPALEEGEVLKRNFVSFSNQRLCLLAASPSAEVFVRLNYSNTRATSFGFCISAFFSLYLCSAWHNVQQMLTRQLKQARTFCGGLVSEF